MQRQRNVQRSGGTLAACCVLLGSLALIAAIYFSIRFFIPVPYEDQWAVIAEMADHPGRYPLQLLWAQHNEHRLPFAKLLMMADLYWFRGHNVSLYLEVYAFQFLHLAILIWALRRASLWPAWMITAGSGLAGFALFWPSQFQSFINPFGVSVLPAYVFGTGALVALCFALERPAQAARWVGAAVVSALLSECSMANGLALWPLLLVVAVRCRLRPALIGILALVAAVAIPVYLYGYERPGQHANPSESITQPLLLLQYLQIYFGSVWNGLSRSFGKLFATLGMVAAVAAYLRELFRPAPRPFPFTLLSLCIFLLGTGFVTALGRINFPLDQASSSRYQSSALLFWLSLALFAMDWASRRQLQLPLIATAAIVLLTAAILPMFPFSLDAASEVSNRVMSGALPLFVDVKDDPEVRKLFVPPELAFAERSFLKSLPSAMFADPQYQLLGKPLTRAFHPAPLARCFGSFDKARRISDPRFPGWELYGWVWDHERMQPVETMVAVTDGKTITGTGKAGLPRPDVHNVFKEVSDPRVGWRVYIQGGPALPSVQVYGVVDGGKSVCLATPEFPLPATKR